MARNTTTMDRHLQMVHADLPESLTFGGVVYACNRCSMSARELDARQAEFADDYLLSLALRVGALDGATAPVEGDTLTYESTTYRVIGTDESPDGLELRMHCGGEYTTRVRP